MRLQARLLKLCQSLADQDFMLLRIAERRIDSNEGGRTADMKYSTNIHVGSTS